MIQSRAHRPVRLFTAYLKQQSSTIWDRIIILNICSQNFQWNVENHAADEAAFVYSQAYGLTFTMQEKIKRY